MGIARRGHVGSLPRLGIQGDRFGVVLISREYPCFTILSEIGRRIAFGRGRPDADG